MSEVKDDTNPLGNRMVFEREYGLFKQKYMGVEPVLYDDGISDHQVKDSTKNLIAAYLDHYSRSEFDYIDLFRSAFELWCLSLRFAGKYHLVEGMYRNVPPSGDQYDYMTRSGPFDEEFARLCDAMSQERKVGTDLYYRTMSPEELVAEMEMYTTQDGERISFGDVPRRLWDVISKVHLLGGNDTPIMGPMPKEAKE